MAPTKNTRAVAKQQVANASAAAAESSMVTGSTRAAVRLATKVLTAASTRTRGGAAIVSSSIQDQNDVDMVLLPTRGKRKAEHSPGKNEKAKRSALGNLTNNVKMMKTTNAMPTEEQGKPQVKKELNQSIMSKDSTAAADAMRQLKAQAQSHVTTRAAARNIHAKVLGEQTAKTQQSSAPASVGKFSVAPPPPQAPMAPALQGTSLLLAAKAQLKPMRRISNEFNKTEESLYMSALEDISTSESLRLSGNFDATKRRSTLLQQEKRKMDAEKSGATKTVAIETEATATDKNDDDERWLCGAEMPDGVEDYDKAYWNDLFQVSHYAMNIFNYLKSREDKFIIGDYMKKQVHLTEGMRSLLVDWVVEVQETFELNHETIYLAVKIVDLYLCRVLMHKDKLQLLGAGALLIACKYDERTPPMIEDFLYICDGAYSHDQVIRMEMHVLRTIDYDLGIPLSYRFQRRYARCARVPMSTLTLARYILELSLMDYSTIRYRDSMIACAALFIALRMCGSAKGWTPTLEYYSGYKLNDFASIVPVLNAGLHRKPSGALKTIHAKYSHKVFYEVSKVKLMSTAQLFGHNSNVDITQLAATISAQPCSKP